MNKQRFFTVLRTVLSFLIVFGGWELTSRLLAQQESTLLSETGSVNVPPPANPDTEISYPTLTESEIFTVLSIWETNIDELPHEPKNGQLTMEQAIAAGKAGLAFLNDRGIIPSEFITLDTINAALCEGTDSSRLLPMPRELRQDDIRSSEDLNPFYSYWKVSFSSGQANAALVINAVTGQVWKAKIEHILSDHELESQTENPENQMLQEDETIASAFYTYLEQKENALFEVIVEQSNTKIGDNSYQRMLDIHLAGKK